MALSNRKCKQVRNLLGRLPVAEIAQKLELPESEVEAELALWQAAGGVATVPTMPWLVRLLLVLILVGPLVWLNGLYDFSDAPKALLIQFGTMVLLGCWLVVAARSGELRLRSSQVLWPLVASLAWMGVALAYAPNRYEGYWYLFRWLPALPIVVIGAATLREPSWRRTLLLTIALTGALAALLGAVQTLTGWSPVEQAQRPASCFANRNMAVDFVLLTLSLAVAWALEAPSRRQRWTAAGAVLVMLFFIAATGCRAGWLSAAIQAGFWGGYLGWRWWRQGRDAELWRRTGLLVVMAAVAVAAALFTPEVREVIFRRAKVPVAKVIEQVQQKTPGDEQESSIVWRIRTWRNTLAMIHDYPWLGVGLGNHKVLYPLYHRRGVVVKSFDEKRQLAHVHNDFLQLWAETGLVGVLLLLWLFVATAREYRANWARLVPGFPALTFALAPAVLGGLAVSAFFSFPMYRAAPPLVLAGMLAVIAAAGPESAAAGRTRRISPRWCGAAAVGVLALIVGHLFWAWHYLRADQLHRLAISADAQKRWDLVIRFGQAALKHDPWRMKTQFYVGRALAEAKRSQEAVTALEEVLVAYPHYLNAWYNLGLAYSDAKDLDNAIRAYQEAIKIKPDFSLGQNNLGCLYLNRKEDAQAAACFRAAIEADPLNALPWNNLGLIDIRRQAYSEAAVNFERALALEPDAMLAHKNLGILYYQYLNRREDSLVHLRRTLELDPKVDEAPVIRQILAEEERKQVTPPPKPVLQKKPPVRPPLPTKQPPPNAKSRRPGKAG